MLTDLLKPLLHTLHIYTSAEVSVLCWCAWVYLDANTFVNNHSEHKQKSKHKCLRMQTFEMIFVDGVADEAARRQNVKERYVEMKECAR